jgi:hypothetical protein
MKERILTCCIASIFLLACNNEKAGETKSDESKNGDTSNVAAKPEKKNDNTYTMPDSNTAKQNWMTYAAPGEMQKMLAKWNGEWSAEISMWETPGGPEMKATGTMSNKMIMDGRYQLSNFKATMMGMPMEGMSTVAFDNHKKVFISTWIDNMGTGLTTFEGTWDDATKSMTSTAKMMDPQLAKELTMREVFKVVDDSHQVMEMYKPAPDGKEFKNMEVRYTRKK